MQSRKTILAATQPLPINFKPEDGAVLNREQVRHILRPVLDSLDCDDESTGRVLLLLRSLVFVTHRDPVTAIDNEIMLGFAEEALGPHMLVVNKTVDRAISNAYRSLMKIGTVQ